MLRPAGAALTNSAFRGRRAQAFSAASAKPSGRPRKAQRFHGVCFPRHEAWQSFIRDKREIGADGDGKETIPSESCLFAESPRHAWPAEPFLPSAATCPAGGSGSIRFPLVFTNQHLALLSDRVLPTCLSNKDPDALRSGNGPRGLSTLLGHWALPWAQSRCSLTLDQAREGEGRQGFSSESVAGKGKALLFHVGSAKRVI